MKVAVVKESAPGERRVALVPETVPRLTAAGLEVLVEQGAGDAAWFPDSAYAEAGATVVATADLYAAADVILTVTRPDEAAMGRLRAGRAGARRRLGLRADRAAHQVPRAAARRRRGGGGREDQRAAPGRGWRPGRRRRDTRGLSSSDGGFPGYDPEDPWRAQLAPRRNSRLPPANLV